MRFIGREQDMAFFERCYEQPTAQLVFLYGRRRVGKTELLRRFASVHPSVWFTCTKDPDALQLRAFSARILMHDAQAARLVDSFSSWEQAFAEIAHLDMPGKKLVIIDEFPYAVFGNSALPSILQDAWDSVLSREDIMLVLCGSSMSFMENELLAQKNPLYGRATGVWRMEPLGYEEAARFFPDYTPQQKLEAYGILGGVPHYLSQFDPALDIRENVCCNVLARGCPLYVEAEFLLREELREPATYNAVLSAVSAGETELNGIAQKAMIETRTANTYLTRLRNLHIVEKEFSVHAGQQERSKQTRGLWRVSDNFMRFWYAAARQHVSDLELGDAQGVWEHFIEPHLNEFLSRAFEDVCLQWMRRRAVDGELPFRAHALGRWWHGSHEIDIAALGPDDAHILGECKFQGHQVTPSALHRLEEKERAFFPNGEGWRYLFSKNGYVQGDDIWHNDACPGHVRLIVPEDLER